MMRGTTIIAVRKDKKLAIAGDGQVTMGDKTIMKGTAKKVRKIYNGEVLIGFAGSVADAVTLAEILEEKLEQYDGNLRRAAVEMAKDWRRDKVLRQLEAMVIAGDKENLLVISGSGEVIEPDQGIIAIGSGGNYALAAGKALLKHSELDIETIAKESLYIASTICVYTNDNITVEVL
ncbi:ATP-dependent protease subunit HslV [Anaerosalibacter bizertensis]|uniref:ATP-dependent protease subunit HslV n=1 Tax=Anaerosalibacter bizertensis TaxID=932217 RepID=A0A844FIP6_9FIRM|nr:ATP-dependent protease subunit HslV [Anaerosalibacter bizertensis]MBV1816562.1 ATP-dependent protease subunit HslV [Bacteroidales bacterium MSK.15.36]HHV27224.1 ATP-dependent protease subunit HslV [Tissierellia bacterium]MBU5293308.1 ATP-dependent protease subunit HslV [Anaerosalibacter bizertensis]MCB5558634.1 ATP-dependent protease subunit HslV [Anaerosalibacter bizertensis]MCG4563949.1 ATP-dependent protease subunit HslV [Anaerosalibacter bizertensis]